jgi:hypothetical protein
VTREHLIGLPWPKGVVDFDTGLNTAIRKLRSTLGDVAETPRYIETLPRLGPGVSPGLRSHPQRGPVPPYPNRIEPWRIERALYRRRNEIGRLFRRLKGFRRIFSRFGKLDMVFIAFIYFALVVEAPRG